jgi:hypothetical protein
MSEEESTERKQDIFIAHRVGKWKENISFLK